MIIKLHKNLINKIAAGEVVERPASVVKELIENAIDAQARKIQVLIKGDGTELIEIQDDGIGMNKEDADLAFDSHTTSKIISIEDLNTIATMGFRGEALASIASVAKVTLTTKDKKEKVGTSVVINNGKKKKVKEVTINQGTKISVEHLFHEIPARKKFLKSTQTEYRHILDTFINYALSNPHIHFTLHHNGKEIYNLPAISKPNFTEEISERITDLYSKSLSENIIPIYFNAPNLQIQGVVGHPSIARPNRSHQVLFINKRPISDKLVSKAVYDGFNTLIPKKVYPKYFLFLNIPPSEVDVNVHPRKNEVRFEKPQNIFLSVRNAINQNIQKFLKNKTTKNFEKKDYIFSKKAQSKAQSGLSKIQKTKQTTSVSSALDFTRELLKNQKKKERNDYTFIRENNVDYDGIPYFRTMQVFNNFIIVEKKDTLLIIDQHAAAERVTYNQLLNQIKNKRIERQKLLIPEVIECDKPTFVLLKEYRKSLDKLGITLTVFGKSSFKIEDIPALLSQKNIKEMVYDIADEISSGNERKKPKTFTEIEEKVIATMACHSSIRAGMRLKQEEVDYLIKQLLSTNSSYSCPHGRPIIWELSKYELEKKFKRH